MHCVFEERNRVLLVYIDYIESESIVTCLELALNGYIANDGQDDLSHKLLFVYYVHPHVLSLIKTDIILIFFVLL
jgi:hypothetical protein